MSNEINPQLAFEVIARIVSIQTGCEVTVTVKEKPADDTAGERSEDGQAKN